MDERKGFLTKAQEKQIDDLVESTGIKEALDGPAISIADNQGLERLKPMLKKKYPDVIPIIYEIIDAIFDALPKK